MNREDFVSLEDDYKTALNYYRLTDGFPDLKRRYYQARDEYYKEVLDTPVILPKGLELRVDET